MSDSSLTLVQRSAVEEYSKDGGIKKYPSLELVRIEKKLFNKKNNSPKVLEYAFGSGCNTEFLVNEGYEVFGVDVSKVALKNTKSRFNKNKKYLLKKVNLSLIKRKQLSLNLKIIHLII